MAPKFKGTGTKRSVPYHVDDLPDDRFAYFSNLLQVELFTFVNFYDCFCRIYTRLLFATCLRFRAFCLRVHRYHLLCL